MSTTVMTAQAGSTGGTPTSSDGLICPAAFPCSASDLDIAAIETGARSIRTMKDKVQGRMDAIHATWKALPEHYEAPEQEQVYQLMDKPKKAADDLADCMEKVAGYIDDYAGELAGLKSGLAEFEKRAIAFENEARQGYDEQDTPMLGGSGPAPVVPLPKRHVPWNEHSRAVKKNVDLLEEYAGYIERISRAAATAANGINALLKNSSPANVEVITADAIMSSPDAMPWGAPVDEDRDCPESMIHGTGNWGKSIIYGGAALAGFDIENKGWAPWENWSWDTAQQTWMGVADFASSTVTVVVFTPLSWIPYAPIQDSAEEKLTPERWSTVRAGWLTPFGWDEQTHLAGGDGWAKAKDDPVAAITEGVLTVATFFIPGVGQGGGVAKGAASAARAGSMAGKGGKGARTAVTITGHAADFVMPGGAFLIGKGAKSFNIGHPHPSRLNPLSEAGGPGLNGRSSARTPGADSPSGSSARSLDRSPSVSSPDAGNARPSTHSRSEDAAPAGSSAAAAPTRGAAGGADGPVRGSEADAPTGGGRYDPDAPVVETINQTELGRKPTAAERQQALDNAPWIEKDGKRVPVDHRTGRPLVLENAGGSSGWHAKPDADGQNWYAENPSKNPTQFEPTGEPGSYGYDMDGNLLKYAEYRPKHTLEQIIEVWNRARAKQATLIEQGVFPFEKLRPNELWVRVRDDAVETPETGKIIDLGPGDGTSLAEGKWRKVTWEPGQPREGVWDMGHLRDSRYADEHHRYMSSGGEYTSEDFRRWYQDPDFYEPQDPSRNRSGVDDKK